MSKERNMQIRKNKYPKHTSNSNQAFFQKKIISTESIQKIQERHGNINYLKSLAQQKLNLAKLYLQDILKTANHQSQSRYIELAHDVISPQLQHIEDIVQGIERIQKSLNFEPILVTPKNQESSELQLVTDRGQIKLDESFFIQPYDEQVKFLIDTTAQLNGVDNQYKASSNAMQEVPPVIKDKQGWAAYIDTLLQVSPEQLPTHVSDLITLSKTQIELDNLDDDDIDEDNDNSSDDEELTIENNPDDDDTDEDNDNSSDDEDLTIEDNPNTSLVTLDEGGTSFWSKLMTFIKNIFNRGT